MIFQSAARAGAVTFHGAERLAQATLQAGAFSRVASRAVESDDPSAARNQIHEALERGLDGIEIFVDIGMIELDGGEDDRVGKVMQELRSLVEESGVVLVAFQNEMFSLSEMKAGAKVFCDSADQKRWLHACGMKDPRQHGGGGGLAVRAGDDQHFPAAQEFVMQQLRERTKWDALVKDAFEFNVTARNCIAHDHQIGNRIEIARVKRLSDGDSQFFQKI